VFLLVSKGTSYLNLFHALPVYGSGIKHQFSYNTFINFRQASQLMILLKAKHQL